MIKIRDKYLISVIIPFVNYDKNLIEIINNIKNRKNLNFLELILLNDSKKKISKKKLKLSNNIVFRNINSFSGPGIARNEGIKISKGKWIMFLDSDDRIDLNRIIEIKNYLLNSNKNIIAYDYESNEKNYTRNKKKFKLTYSNYNLKKKITNFFYLRLHYPIIFYFLKKNFLKKNKIKFSKGFYEDIPFLLRLMLSNKKHIPFIRKKIYKKNFRKNSITSLLEKRHIEGYILAWFLCAKLLKKNFKEKEFVRNLIQVAFRGVLGYLILKLKKDKKTNYKNNIIFKNLIKKINPNFKNNLKYDQITRFFLENEKI